MRVKVLRTVSLHSKIEPFAHLLVLAAVTFSANIAGTGSISGALAAIYEYHATGGGWCCCKTLTRTKVDPFVKTLEAPVLR